MLGAIGIGGPGNPGRPSHTTRHAGPHRAVGMVEVAVRVAAHDAWYRLLSTRRSWLPRCHTYSGFTLTGIVASFTFVNI